MIIRTTPVVQPTSASRCGRSATARYRSTAKSPRSTPGRTLGDVTDHQIKAWERARPAETNTGSLTRNNPAFDVDILSNAEVADAVADLIDEWLRDRGRVMVRFGRKPKRAILCRTEAPFKKFRVELDSSFTDPDTGEIKYDAIEVLGDGQQLACLGEHPDTGEAYEWVGGSPVYVHSAELPLITEADAHAIVDKAVATLAERFGINVRTPARVARPEAPIAAAKTTDAATAWAPLRSETPARRSSPRGAGRRRKRSTASAYGIGQLVGGGELPEGEALEGLLGAAEKIPDHDPKNPWNAADLDRKVRKALRDGMSSPRAAPKEGNDLPRVKLTFRKAGEAEPVEEDGRAQGERGAGRRAILRLGG